MLTKFQTTMIASTLALMAAGPALAAGHANPTVGGAEMRAEQNIVENAVNSPIHTTLVAAVQAAGLVDTLIGPGPFTVFAPTDDAFAALPAGTVETLVKPENKDALVKILTCHVVGAEVMAAAVIDMVNAGGGSAEVDTLGGCTLTAALDGDMVTITDEMGGTATVTVADVKQSNGVIHVVNAVLLPGADDAMEEDSMGADAMKEDAMMEKEDSMMKEDAMAMENPMVGGAEMLASRDIIDNAVNSPIHTTLVAAVQAAELVDTLKGPGPFTVFAPTDDAFAALPAGTVEELLKPENKATLQKVLTAHVVAGAVTAEDLTRKARHSHDGFYHFNAVSGDALSAKVTHSGRVFIFDEHGSAYEVTTADVMQSNGVIHVVEGALLPR